ncbi:MAG: entericidin EcnA/B family protein [Phycisphaerae bacterium]
MVKKIVLCIILIVLCLSLIGCQTVAGIGGDIKWTGQKGGEILGGKKAESGDDRY